MLLKVGRVQLSSGQERIWSTKKRAARLRVAQLCGQRDDPGTANRGEAPRKRGCAVARLRGCAVARLRGADEWVDVKLRHRGKLAGAPVTSFVPHPAGDLFLFSSFLRL